MDCDVGMHEDIVFTLEDSTPNNRASKETPSKSERADKASTGPAKDEPEDKGQLTNQITTLAIYTNHILPVFIPVLKLL